MKLYAIRHTSVDVEPGICYGQSDVGVAATFNEEKKELVRRISKVGVQKVYSSPLFRCKTLAENLFANDNITFDERLKELNFGDWELRSWEEIYAHPKGKLWMNNYQTLPTLNGESYPEMYVRINSFVADLAKKKYKNVAVVTHAGVIRILKSMLDKESIIELFETFKPAYGSITEFEL